MVLFPALRKIILYHTTSKYIQHPSYYMNWRTFSQNYFSFSYFLMQTLHSESPCTLTKKWKQKNSEKQFMYFLTILSRRAMKIKWAATCAQCIRWYNPELGDSTRFVFLTINTSFSWCNVKKSYPNNFFFNMSWCWKVTVLRNWPRWHSSLKQH